MVANPASRNLAVPDYLEFPDAPVGAVVRKEIRVYNLADSEAYIQLSIEDTRDRVETAPFQIESAPTRLRPRREDQPAEPLKITFQLHRPGSVKTTLRVTAHWQDRSIPREQWTVGLRGWTRSERDERQRNVGAPRVAIASPTPAALPGASASPSTQPIPMQPTLKGTGPCAGTREKMAEAADFVPRVRDIMLAKNWSVAARLQDLWLSRKANYLVGDASEGAGSAGPVPVETGSLDWMLQFDRCKSLFETMCGSDVFANQPATSLLMSRVLDRFQRDGGAMVPLGNLTVRGRALEREYINFRPLGRQTPYAYYSYGGSASYDLIDEFTAAYGNITMYVIPHGQADRSQGRIRVRIDKLGIYARDSFDFNGDQFLGHWHLPGDVAVFRPSGNRSRDPHVVTGPDPREVLYPRCAEVGWHAMSNATYRRYRTKYGYGCDFLIYTDVKVVPLSPEYVYVY